MSLFLRLSVRLSVCRAFDQSLRGGDLRDRFITCDCQNKHVINPINHKKTWKDNRCQRLQIFAILISSWPRFRSANHWYATNPPELVIPHHTYLLSRAHAICFDDSITTETKCQSLIRMLECYKTVMITAIASGGMDCVKNRPIAAGWGRKNLRCANLMCDDGSKSVFLSLWFQPGRWAQIEIHRWIFSYCNSWC